VDIPFQSLNTRLVEKAVSQKWFNENYSDRIWGKGHKLADKLAEIIPREIAVGHSAKKMAEAIQDAMNTSYNNSIRLARTEFVHIANEARLDSFKEIDDEIDKINEELGLPPEEKVYEYTATLEENTCDICGDLDSRVFRYTDAEEGVNMPPMHPNCRCTIIPAFSDGLFQEGQMRATRDENGKTILVPKQSYKEWKDGLKKGEDGKQKYTYETKINKTDRELTPEQKERLKEFEIDEKEANKRLAAEELPFDRLETAEVTIEGKGEDKKGMPIPDRDLFSSDEVEKKIEHFKELKNNDDGNKEKAKEIKNVLNELSIGEKSKDITEKYFDTKNIDTGVKEVVNENGQRVNASLNRDKNGKDTIFFDENKAPDFYSGMSKINDGVNSDREININEKETLSVSYYGHEQEHHLQKHIETIDKNTPKLAVRLLDIAAEIKGRERAIGFLKDVHKDKKIIPDFEGIINNGGAYNPSISRLNRFFDKYGIENREEIMNKFAEKTHKDYFYPENTTRVFLAIINKDREDKLKKVDLQEYILPDK